MRCHPVLRDYFYGASLHPQTRDWLTRLAAAGASATSREIAAHNYYATALIDNQGLNPANLFAHTFCGGFAGVVVPFFNRGGAVGNSTNVGYVAGDYGEFLGLAQSGMKRLESGLFTSALGINSVQFGAYHSSSATGDAVLFGGGGASNANVATLQIRVGAGGSTRALLNAAGAVNFADSVTGFPTAARVAGISNGATDLRVFRGGAQSGSTQTGTRTAPTGSVPIWFGTYNANGTALSPALATQCVSGVICNTVVTPSQYATIDAITREFLVRLGRPPCD